MLDYKNIFSISPFSLNEKEKEKWYFDNQKKLTSYHYKNCKEYKNITNKIYGGFNKSKKLSELPFVPANLFKDFFMGLSFGSCKGARNWASEKEKRWLEED